MAASCVALATLTGGCFTNSSRSTDCKSWSDQNGYHTRQDEQSHDVTSDPREMFHHLFSGWRYEDSCGFVRQGTPCQQTQIVAPAQTASVSTPVFQQPAPAVSYQTTPPATITIENESRPAESSSREVIPAGSYSSANPTVIHNTVVVQEEQTEPAQTEVVSAPAPTIVVESCAPQTQIIQEPQQPVYADPSPTYVQSYPSCGGNYYPSYQGGIGIDLGLQFGGRSGGSCNRGNNCNTFYRPGPVAGYGGWGHGGGGGCGNGNHGGWGHGNGNHGCGNNGYHPN